MPLQPSNCESLGIMREINLQEFQTSGPFQLSAVERDLLMERDFDIAVEPASGSNTEYYLRASSTVGSLQVGHLSVLIEPKIGIPKLLSLACYAMGKVKFRRDDFEFPDEFALPDALALALSSQGRRAFSGGLLHGYRLEEEALQTIRGRVNFDEQLRRRYNSRLPVEVQYDEFTADILANQLVKAATYRLSRLRLRSPETRRRLESLAAMLSEVSLYHFPPSRVPPVSFNRLNEHYRPVVELSRLILRHGAYESGRGDVRASAFLMNMNVIFQEFLTQALREALRVSERILCSFRNPSGDSLKLDIGRKATIEPDLMWWDGANCLFVGDAKYKTLTNKGAPNADLYQVLSYATALNLPGGLLVYADGKTGALTYTVRNSGKRLEIAVLDLSGSLEEVLASAGEVAEKLKELRDEARIGVYVAGPAQQ